MALLKIASFTLDYWIRYDIQTSILYKLFVKIKYNEYDSSLFFEGDTESSAAKPELEGRCYLTDFPLSLEFLQQFYHHYNSLSSNINIVFQ